MVHNAKAWSLCIPLACVYLQLLAEYVFDQGSRLRCGIGATLLFSLSQHVEQAIKSLADHIAIKVEVLIGQRNGPAIAFCASWLDCVMTPTFSIDL